MSFIPSWALGRTSRFNRPAIVLRCTTLALLFLLVPALAASAQDASSQIKSEIERLQQSLKDKPVASSDLPNANSIIGDALKGSSAALDTGYLYLSLERLGQAEDFLQGARTVDEKAETIKDSLPACEEEWGKASQQLTAFDKTAWQRSWERTPVAIRALAEAAQGRTLPLLEGGRGFASATKPHDGLFYIGQALGEAAFADFLHDLKIARKGTPFPLRSFLPELQALQEKTNAAFQPPLSIDMHPRFIALNSTLKFAQELDSSKALAGSLYEYLEAVRHYGMLQASAPDAEKQTELRNRIAAELKNMGASRRDDSIAQIFLERSYGWLNKADGSATAPDEWKAVQVIAEQVLPAYYAALKPGAVLPQRAGRAATLTLVRWPYT
jgi:hypothetical protein